MVWCWFLKLTWWSRRCGTTQSAIFISYSTVLFQSWKAFLLEWPLPMGDVCIFNCSVINFFDVVTFQPDLFTKFCFFVLFFFIIIILSWFLILSFHSYPSSIVRLLQTHIHIHKSLFITHNSYVRLVLLTHILLWIWIWNVRCMCVQNKIIEKSIRKQTISDIENSQNGW